MLAAAAPGRFILGLGASSPAIVRTLGRRLITPVLALLPGPQGTDLAGTLAALGPAAGTAVQSEVEGDHSR